MLKKMLFPSAIVISLFLFASYFYNYVVLNQNTQKYATKFENHLHQQEQEIKSIFSNTTFLAEVLHTEPSINYGENVFEKLEEISKKPYHFALFKGDSLVLWSNNKIKIDKKYISKIPLLLELSNGLYQSISQDIEIPKYGKLKAIGLIPIKYNYKSQSKHLKSYLAIDDNFPSEIKISETKTPNEIKSISGEHLCFLDTDGDILDHSLLLISFFFFFIALIFAIINVVKITSWLNKTNFKLASLHLFSSLLGMLFIFYYFDFEHKFESYSLFQSISLNENFYLSYASILLQLTFGMSALIFVLDNFKISAKNPKKYIFIANGILLSIGIVITLILTIFGFKSLILDTNQDFNFYKSMQFAHDNYFGLITIVLMTLIQFVLSIVLMHMIKEFSFSTKVRYSIYFASVIMVILLNRVMELNLAFSILIPYIIILFIALDLYISKNKKKFLKPVWLIGLPIITTLILINFHSDKENILKLEYAKTLSENQDEIAEKEFYSLKSKFENDSEFNALSNDTILDHSILKNKMEDIFSESGYLMNYYNFDFYVYNDAAKSLVKDEKVKQLTIFNVFKNAKATQYPDITLYTDPNSYKSYYLMRFVTGQTSNQPKEFFVNLYKNKNPSSKIYTELLAPTKFKGLDQLDKYSYAIYNSKGLVYKSDDSFSSSFDYKSTPAKGEFIETKMGNANATIYQNDNNVLTVIKNVPIDWYAKLSLFAILYISVFFLIIVIGSLNTVLNFLPNELGINFTNHSLRDYLYRNILGLLAFSLVTLGIITWAFFKDNTASYHDKRLSRKTNTIIKDLEHELTLLMDNPKTGNIKNALHSIDLKAISKIHKPDVNLYDLSGKLIKASDWIIFKKGVISKQMDYPAYFSLAKNRKNEYVDNQGQIGKTTYKISYKPVTFVQDHKKKTIGYLGFPYYSKKSNLDSDVYGFMGNLITTYVFLFLIAGIFISLLATKITSPIESLATKLKDFRLGGTNENIEKTRQDEVGDLIDEYNRLTVKLEEGAKNFKQLEKEKAFRDMARSVAHDIKNPLTPMKLHIQFLELSMNSSPEEFKNRVMKTSKTLLEQISHIENIVSALNVVETKKEFQNLSLSSLVESAYNLYKPKKDISISLAMPNTHFYISADEDQISRVLNNLLTNANQALDEFGERRIDIIMAENNNNVVVEIKDTGCGIPEEMHDKILELNFTTKTTGSGLGLSMVRTIVEGSNGRIYFTSEVGVGTSFFIEFPIIDKEPYSFGYEAKGLGA